MWNAWVTSELAVFPDIVDIGSTLIAPRLSALQLSFFRARRRSRTGRFHDDSSEELDERLKIERRLPRRGRRSMKTTYHQAQSLLSVPVFGAYYWVLVRSLRVVAPSMYMIMS
jgi:hypothetical protein